MEMKKEKQAENFRQLAKLYYEGNFGTVTKGEIDLLMFKFYYDSVLESYKDDEGKVDFTKITNYSMAKDLGVTSQRIAALRGKVELRYPSMFDLEASFKELAKGSFCHVGEKYVTLSVSDPRLRNELEDLLIRKGEYVEHDNSLKTLKMAPSSYIGLFVDCAGVAEDDLVKKLKDMVKDNEQVMANLTSSGWRKWMKENISVSNVLTVAGIACQLIQQ